MQSVATVIAYLAFAGAIASWITPAMLGTCVSKAMSVSF